MDTKGIDRRQKIKSEVEKLSLGDLQLEVASWREQAKTIQRMANELAEFKTFATSADELAAKIRALNEKFGSLVEFRDAQIKDMVEFIGEIQRDPTGAGKLITKMKDSKVLSPKKKLH